MPLSLGHCVQEINNKVIFRPIFPISTDAWQITWNTPAELFSINFQFPAYTLVDHFYRLFQYHKSIYPQPFWKYEAYNAGFMMGLIIIHVKRILFQTIENCWKIKTNVFNFQARAIVWMKSAAHHHIWKLMRILIMSRDRIYQAEWGVLWLLSNPVQNRGLGF